MSDWGDWDDCDEGEWDEGEDGRVSAYLLRIRPYAARDSKPVQLVVYTWDMECAVKCGEVLSAIYL